MKKIVSVFLLTALLLTLTSCFRAVDADPKTFTKDNFSITLTEAFTEKEEEGTFVAYDAYDVAIYCIREAFSDFPDGEATTLAYYADLLCLANEDLDPSSPVQNGSYYYTEYVVEEDGSEYHYFCAMFRGTDAFYSVEFNTAKERYPQYKSYFETWAASVAFAA